MSIVRNATLLVAAVTGAKFIGFAQSFIVAHVLGPREFGIWITLLLILAYSPIVCLGTVEAMLKQVPHFVGRNDLKGVSTVESGVLGSIMIGAGVFVLLGIFVFLPILPESLQERRGVLAAWCIAISLSCFSSFFYFRFAAYENFKWVSLMEMLRCVLALGLIGGLGWAWGLSGAVVGYLLHELIMCLVLLYYNVRQHGQIGVSFGKQMVMAIRVGFPITIIWWILTLQASVDRVVLGSLLGPDAVGYFGLGIAVITAVSVVPMAVGRVLYPRMNKEFGAHGSSASIKNLVLMPTLVMGAILANMQTIVLSMIPLLYIYILPKYEPGLAAAQVLVLGAFYICIFRNAANYLIAANQERRFLFYILVSLFLNVIADVTLVKLGYGIEGIAVGTALGGFLLSTLVWRRVLIGLDVRRRICLRLMELYAPGLLVNSAFFVVKIFSADALHRFNLRLLWIGLGMLIFLNLSLFCIPSYRGECCQIVSRAGSSLRRLFFLRGRLQPEA